MTRQLSCGSAGEFSRWAGRCHAAPLASINQMGRHVWRDSAGEYQADERAGLRGAFL